MKQSFRRVRNIPACMMVVGFTSNCSGATYIASVLTKPLSAFHKYIGVVSKGYIVQSVSLAPTCAVFAFPLNPLFEVVLHFKSGCQDEGHCMMRL